MKNVITIDDFSREEIDELLNMAKFFKEEEIKGNRHSNILKNKIVGPFFAQESTRTKGSFIMAMKELGGSIYSFHADTSSLKKNESILYTVQMFHAHHVDAIVMRHPYDGSVQWAADVSKLPVVNGGDGKNWHPTQALLDLFTMKEIMGTLDNLKVGLSGDLKYGRTVHSLPVALSKYKNIELHIGSSDLLMMPDEIIEEVKKKGVKVFKHDNIIDVLKRCDIHYHTRPQFNLMKQDPNAPNEEVILNELEKWRITKNIIDQLDNVPFIMHPLPIDSLVSEIDIEVAFLHKQKFLIQAESGVFMRKAILTKILKNTDYILFDGNISNLYNFYGKNIIDRSFETCDLNSKNKLNPGEIKPIVNGYVIDRLEPYTDKQIIEKLNLPYKGVMSTSKITNSKNGKLKSILFITDYDLTDKEMKIIARISKNATFNQIKDGKIIRKFVYPTCNNNNCVSNYINEEVPIRFQLNPNNKIECRYCRSLIGFNISKLTEEDKLKYINNLEKRKI